MQSLFSDSGISLINERIDRLRPDSRAQWGKMDVTRMLAHCQGPLDIGTSSEPLPKYNFLMRLVGNMVKKSLLKNDAPFKQNQPTDKRFIIADGRNFDTEKAKLKESIQAFSQKGRSGKLNEQHPFFGHLSQSDWDKLQTKHLDHHLRQFGV